MNSLRTRLLVGLIGAVVVTGLLGGYVVYRNALQEANAFFDRQLQETAMLLREQAYGFVEREGLPEQVPRFEFVVQVFTFDGRRVYRSEPGVSLPDAITLGWSTIDTRDGRWRAFGVLGPLHVIQVAQPLSVREARAANLALRTLLPFTLLVPLLALLILWIVRRSLTPLQTLAASIAGRAPDSVATLPTIGLPIEVQPLVGEFNALLGRLRQALERERAFTADAAHELRSPLTALRLQLERLAAAAGEADTAEHADAQRQLEAGVERATRLVEQLLSMARLERDRPADRRSVALDELARELVAEVLPLADRRRVDLGLPQAEPLSVVGEPEALRALIGNLVDNAVRHVRERGRVDVVVRRADGPQGPGALIEVIDDGPGIPLAERGRVFDRFYRLPGTASAGSGVGLAIVRSMVERHGGRIELDDAPGGQGLAARVWLPLASPPGPSAAVLRP